MNPEIKYYPSGKIKWEIYKAQNNYIHRIHGPACIKYYEDGNIEYEEYRIDGSYHRLDGPAIILYYDNGKIFHEEYWVSDNFIPKNKLDEILEQCDNDNELLKDLLTLRYM